MLASPGSECRAGADDDFASAPPPSHPSEHSGSGDAALSSADLQTSLLALVGAEPLEMRLLLAATPGDGRLGRGDATALHDGDTLHLTVGRGGGGLNASSTGLSSETTAASASAAASAAAFAAAARGSRVGQLQRTGSGRELLAAEQAARLAAQRLERAAVADADAASACVRTGARGGAPVLSDPSSPWHGPGSRVVAGAHTHTHTHTHTHPPTHPHPH
jgi:hypothetical protein